MSKGKASGLSLTNHDASIVLGMVARGDREHDIAAWFGVNQGRIAEVKQGSHGSISVASATELPPTGPPGPKGKRLHWFVEKAIGVLQSQGNDGALEALKILQDGKSKYDANEA